MYDADYGTDWDTLDREATLERAFALGVASVLGTPNEEEYRRLREAADTTYERSLVELAHNEGRRKARNQQAPDTDPSDVWASLVRDEDEPTTADENGDSRPRGLPPALDRVAHSSLPDDGRDQLRLPDFLRRD